MSALSSYTSLPFSSVAPLATNIAIVPEVSTTIHVPPTIDIAQNGWSSLPLDPSQLWGGKPFRNIPEPILVDDIKFPEDPIAVEVQKYAKEMLPIQTFNHSMRVFYFASAIVMQQFPKESETFNFSTLALASLLHDIGTTDDNLSSTHMSFEFYGGYKALSLLLALGASKDQAEAVAETIIRHQDLGTAGNITFLGQVIQLATIYDNVSDHPYLKNITELIHVDTLQDVIRAFPRQHWLGCFAGTIEREESLKPWCHSTHIPDFAQAVLNNTFMQPYE
ncbi:Cyanamide hydratase [Trichoderma lentiforme]|uniref:Cyanamide hydratase n=1 Tax=Trichoderma lentiforme TaxID=1567552 RepID=A0A9P5CF88_9HYPO|nr:Cyanamide hydratase [Trichoderma lentiforme]